MRRCGAGMLTAHPQATQAERATHAGVRIRRTHALGLAYAKAYGHPCGALANRLLRHADALVPFVRIDVVRADTNLAERSIRPLVVVRKIRGGSRSAEGTQTRMGRSSMCATWQARKLNPCAECLNQLRQPTAAASENGVPQI